MAKKTEIPFNKVIQAMLDTDTPFPPRYLYRLSDVLPNDLELLKSTWPNVSTRRRQALLEDIADLSEDDYMLDFSAISWLALKDPDPEVRCLGVKALAEYEEPDLVPVILKMVESDGDVNVRSEAARAFAPFIFMGEVEEIPEATLHQVEECLLKVARGTDAALVKRRALESLGYSSRKEVDPFIQKAYETNDQEWLVSSLLAMGRSCNTAWAKQVIEKLDDPRPAVRAEAASSVGELDLKKMLKKLKVMLRDEEEVVRASAIWSLSQIGGEGVADVLEAMLENTDDEDEADLIEAALENLEFASGEGLFSMIDLSDPDLADEAGGESEEPDEDEDEQPNRSHPKRKKDDAEG